MRYELPQPFQDLDHIADVGVAVEGASAEEALARLVLAFAFAALLAGGGSVLRRARRAAGGCLRRGLTGVAMALLRELLFRFSTRSLRNHKALILNWFRARGQVSTGAVEGLNNKLKVITRRAFGFRTYEAVETALYHALGDLPDPAEQEFTHRFY